LIETCGERCEWMVRRVVEKRLEKEVRDVLKKHNNASNPLIRIQWFFLIFQTHWVVDRRMASKRSLIKGPLRPPERDTKALSYTQAPVSKDEVTVRDAKEKAIEGETITPLMHLLTFLLSLTPLCSHRILLSCCPAAVS
jgi:hypothetical protein